MESKGRLSTEDCIRFDDFTEGRSMGEASVTLTDELIKRWVALYPGDGALLPAMPDGMTSVLVMRAYMEILSPRPPGNIHAAQSFTMNAGVTVGDRITTELVCARKWERKGRHWLELKTTSRHDSGERAFTGVMTMIWAL